jgi:hypothetical protein
MPFAPRWGEPWPPLEELITESVYSSVRKRGWAHFGRLGLKGVGGAGLGYPRLAETSMDGCPVLLCHSWPTCCLGSRLRSGFASDLNDAQAPRGPSLVAQVGSAVLVAEIALGHPARRSGPAIHGFVAPTTSGWVSLKVSWSCRRPFPRQAPTDALIQFSEVLADVSVAGCCGRGYHGPPDTLVQRPY